MFVILVREFIAEHLCVCIFVVEQLLERLFVVHGCIIVIRVVHRELVKMLNFNCFKLVGADVRVHQLADVQTLLQHIDQEGLQQVKVADVILVI